MSIYENVTDHADEMLDRLARGEADTALANQGSATIDGTLQYGYTLSENPRVFAYFHDGDQVTVAGHSGGGDDFAAEAKDTRRLDANQIAAVKGVNPLAFDSGVI